MKGKAMVRVPLILLVGLPGVGKTTLSWTLGEQLRFAVISKDTIHDTCVSCQFGYEEVEDLAHQLLIAIAREQLVLGMGVILDSASHIAKRREQAKSLAAETGADFHMIECICLDENELRRRITGRDVPGFRVRDWTKFERVSALYEPFTEPRLVLNMLKDVQENVDAIRAYIS